MKKILYIGNIPLKIKAGGDLVNKRNILALKTVFKNDLYLYDLKSESKIYTFVNLMCNCMLGLSLLKIKDIFKFIKSKNINSVFLASSKYGILAKYLKKRMPDIEVIIFYHNIEQIYTKEEYNQNKTYKNLIISKCATYNESLSCKYSDKVITLNERDSTFLKSLYDKTTDFCLPTTFIDNFDKSKENHSTNEKFTILFVGYAFFANIEGIKWFIEEVLPFLENCKLQIVGSGMDTHFKSNDKIEVHGFVEDLSEFYYKTDIVVLPIFSGSGMKTKTAEALMYGCPIVGTNEAFTGFDIDFEKIGGLANTKEEMINCIYALKENKKFISDARKYAREVFTEKYNFDISTKIIAKELL